MCALANVLVPSYKPKHTYTHKNTEKHTHARAHVTVCARTNSGTHARTQASSEERDFPVTGKHWAPFKIETRAQTPEKHSLGKTRRRKYRTWITCTMGENSGGRKRSEQSGANGRANGPVLQSVCLIILAHSGR